MSTRKRTNSKSTPPALVQAYSLVSRAEEARTSGHWEEAVDMYNQASELFLLATNHTSDIETIKQLQLLSQAQSSKALEIQRQLRRFSGPDKGASRTDPIPVPGRTYSTSSASPPNISDQGTTPPAFNASPSSMSPSAQIPNYPPSGSNKSTPSSSYNSSSNILQQPQVPQIPQETPQQQFSNSQYVNTQQGRESFLMGSQNYFVGQAPSAANSVNEILLYQPKTGQPGGYNIESPATIPVQNSEVRFNPANYSNNNSPINSAVTNRGIPIGMESYMGQPSQQPTSYQNLTSSRNSRGGMDPNDIVTEIPLNESYIGNDGSDHPLMNLLPNVDLNNVWTWMEKMLEMLPLKPIANMTNFGYNQSPTPQQPQSNPNATVPASLLNSFYIVPSSQGNPNNMYRVNSPPPATTAKRSSLTMTDEEAQNAAVKSALIEEENKQLKETIQKLQQENEQLRKVCDSGIQYYNDMLKQSIVHFKNEFQKRAKQQQMFNSVNLTPQSATYSQFLGSGKPPLSQSQAVNYSSQINPDKEYIQQLEQRVQELSHQLKLMNEKSIKQQRLIEKYEQRLVNLTEEQRIRRNMSEQSGINHSLGSHQMSNSGMSIGGSISDVGSVYTSGVRSNMQDTQYQSVMNANDDEYSDLSSSILQTKDQLSNLKIQPQ